MASLDPKIATTREDGEKVEKEERKPQKKKGRNRRDHAQAAAKKAKTMASDADLLDVKPMLSLRRSKRMADSNAKQEVAKRQRNEITVKSEDIDGGTTKSKSDVGSQPFKLEGLPKCRSIRYYCSIQRRSDLGEGETKNEWFKIQTFDLRGGGGSGGGGGASAGGGGGGGAVGGSGGNGGGTGGQQR